MGSPRGDRGLYSAPRRGGCPRYASEIRPSGVTHRATRWVVSLIAEHTVLQVPLEISQFISPNPVEISQCLTMQRIPVRASADAATFQLVQVYNYSDGTTDTSESFAKDKSHVFYRGSIIPGADPATFEIIDIDGSLTTFDKNRIYEGERKLERVTEVFERQIWEKTITLKRRDGSFDVITTILKMFLCKSCGNRVTCKTVCLD